MQAALGRYDPVAEEWKLRFRGYVEDFNYDTDPSQQFNRLTVNLVDQFDVLAAADLWPGQAGTGTDPTSRPAKSTSRLQRAEDRIMTVVLTDTGLPSPLRAVLARRGRALADRLQRRRNPANRDPGGRRRGVARSRERVLRPPRPDLFPRPPGQVRPAGSRPSPAESGSTTSGRSVTAPPSQPAPRTPPRSARSGSAAT